jgi:hypothetical protein
MFSWHAEVSLDWWPLLYLGVLDRGLGGYNYRHRLIKRQWYIDLSALPVISLQEEWWRYRLGKDPTWRAVAHYLLPFAYAYYVLLLPHLTLWSNQNYSFSLLQFTAPGFALVSFLQLPCFQWLGAREGVRINYINTHLLQIKRTLTISSPLQQSQSKAQKLQQIYPFSRKVPFYLSITVSGYISFQIYLLLISASFHQSWLFLSDTLFPRYWLLPCTSRLCVTKLFFTSPTHPLKTSSLGR